MKRRALFLFLIPAVFLLTNCGKKTAREQIQQKRCVVTYISGEAFLVDSSYSNLKRLSVEDNLREKDTIRTEKDSTVELLFGDNSIVRIKQDSVLELMQLFQEDEERSTNVFLKFGKLLADPIEQKQGSSFQVETDTVTLAVRGTSFTVVSDSEGSKVAVKTGAVQLKNKISVASIQNIREIDPGIADKIETTINPEITLTSDEKIEIKNDELRKFESEIATEFESVAEELEANRDSKEEIERIAERLEEVQLKEISVDLEDIVQKQTVTEEEWETEFNEEEFEQIQESREKLMEEQEAETETQKEEVRLKESQKAYESLFQQAHQLMIDGKKNAALEMAKKTLTEAKKEFGENHRFTAHAMNELAMIYVWESAHLDEAEDLFNRAIAIYEKVDDKDDPFLCFLYSHYGELFMRKRDFDKARDYFDKAFQLSEKMMNQEVKDKVPFLRAKAKALKELANLYKKQKKFVESEEAFKKALETIEKVEGSDIAEIVYILDDYRHLLKIQNRKIEAEKIDTRIASIIEKNPDSKELKLWEKHRSKRKDWERYDALFQQAHRLNKKGRKAAAIDTAEDTLDRAERELGSENRITARAMQELALFYRSEPDKLSEAEGLLNRAITIYEKVEDKNDPTLCYLYVHYGELLTKKREFDTAKSFFDRSMSILEERIKEQEDDDKKHFLEAKAEALWGLARLYENQQKETESENYYKQAAEFAEKTRGAEDPRLVHILEDYKHLLKRQNRREDAEVVENRILSIMENNLEFKEELERRRNMRIFHQYESLFDRARTLNEEGKKVEAVRMAENLLKRAKRELGPDHRITARAMQELALFYMETPHKHGEAEDLVNKATVIHEKVDEKKDPSLCWLYSMKAHLLVERDELHGAKDSFNRSLFLSEEVLHRGGEEEVQFVRAKAAALKGLADIYVRQELYEEAEEHYKNAIETISEHEGKESPELIHILDSYKNLLEMQNRVKEVAKIEESIAAIKQNLK